MPRLLASALVLGALIAGALLTAPPARADAPAPAVSPSTVPRDGTFTVSGSGCLDPMYNPYTHSRGYWWVRVAGVVPGIAGSAFLDGALPSDDGVWSVTVRWPEAVGPGTYTVQATCEAGPVQFSYPTVPLTVTGPPDPPQWWEPGGSGPPGQPGRPLVPPPVAAPPVATPPARPAPTSAPRTTPSATAVAGSSTAAPRTSTTPSPVEASPPAPAPAPGCADCARVSPEKPLEPGERLSLSWTGFQPGEQVTIVMRSTPVTLGTFTADAAGTVPAAVELPDAAEAGEHTLTFSGPLSGDLVVLPFRIAAAGVETAPAAGPSAGAASDEGMLAPWLVGGGLAVLLLGAGGVTLHRRRRAAAENSSGV